MLFTVAVCGHGIAGGAITWITRNVMTTTASASPKTTNRHKRARQRGCTVDEVISFIIVRKPVTAMRMNRPYENTPSTVRTRSVPSIQPI